MEVRSFVLEWKELGENNKYLVCIFVGFFSNREKFPPTSSFTLNANGIAKRGRVFYLEMRKSLQGSEWSEGAQPWPLGTAASHNLPNSWAFRFVETIIGV